MKLLALCLVYSIAIGDPAVAARAQGPSNNFSGQGMIPDGTPVKLRLAENLSSETAKTGQQVVFEVTEEVSVNGITVIAKGGSALATVTQVSGKKNMGRGGKLDVNIDSVRAVDNQKIQLRASQENKGGGHTGAMTGAMVATSLILWPAAPFFLFMKGKSVEIPKGTEITAFVQGDTRVDMSRMGGGGAGTSGAGMSGGGMSGGGMMSGQQGGGMSNGNGGGGAMVSVTVDANAPGSDIEVDGNFVGSTPSTISVAQGQHTIMVKKRGYAAWSRTMNVSGSGVKLTADLEKLGK